MLENQDSGFVCLFVFCVCVFFKVGRKHKKFPSATETQSLEKAIWGKRHFAFTQLLLLLLPVHSSSLGVNPAAWKSLVGNEIKSRQLAFTIGLRPSLSWYCLVSWDGMEFKVLFSLSWSICKWQGLVIKERVLKNRARAGWGPRQAGQSRAGVGPSLRKEKDPASWQLASSWWNSVTAQDREGLSKSEWSPLWEKNNV